MVLLFAGLTGSIVFFPVRELRRENQVKSVLLSLQRSIQKFHVEFEKYPDPENLELSGVELVAVLSDVENPENLPKNPYTNRPFSTADGPDRITYRTDEEFLTYSLQALRFDRDEVWFEIDSSSHHSLE